MTAESELPDLGRVAFRLDDESDHPGGGHCVSLSQTEAVATRELVDQYLTALRNLAERAAQSPDGGWGLTRPMLFHAHHTAELAAKAALIAGGESVEKHHGLLTLWEAIKVAGLDARVEALEADWCGAFVALIGDLAGNSIGARYAKPSAGHAPIDDVWCCVNPDALFAATERFAIQCIALAPAVEEASA